MIEYIKLVTNPTDTYVMLNIYKLCERKPLIYKRLCSELQNDISYVQCKLKIIRD